MYMVTNTAPSSQLQSLTKDTHFPTTERSKCCIMILRIVMIIKDANGIQTLHFESLSKFDSIIHFISTRKSGFSAPPVDGLNISFLVGDDPHVVLRNRQTLAAKVGIPLQYFTFAKQVHGDRIAIVSDSMRGLGSTSQDTAIDDTDAMVTDQPDICLTVFAADCVPILFYDPNRNVIAAAHAGSQGTMKSISRKVVEVMQSHFGCLPKDILAGIGPSIGSCCYQVGPEIVSRVHSEFGDTDGFITNITEDGRGYLDLWSLNRHQLLSAGLQEDNIEVARICTCCHTETLFSHRKEGHTGRFCAGITLRNENCVSCTATLCNWCSRP